MQFEIADTFDAFHVLKRHRLQAGHFPQRRIREDDKGRYVLVLGHVVWDIVHLFELRAPLLSIALPLGTWEPAGNVLHCVNQLAKDTQL